MVDELDVMVRDFISDTLRKYRKARRYVAQGDLAKVEKKLKVGFGEIVGSIVEVMMVAKINGERERLRWFRRLLDVLDEGERMLEETLKVKGKK